MLKEKLNLCRAPRFDTPVHLKSNNEHRINLDYFQWKYCDMENYY